MGGGSLSAVAKKPAKAPTAEGERPEEFERFESLTRRLTAVPKREVDAARKAELEARRNGNGSHQ